MEIGMPEVQRDKFSYLHARDPSIISCNLPSLVNLGVNGNNELGEVSEEKQQQEDIHVNVYLRIKAGIPFENLYSVLNDTTLVCKIPDGSHALRNTKEGESVTKKYSFSKIFGPQTTQIEIFDYIVKPKMLHFINGNNCTLLTYGASGSGKTFTIVGTDEQPGLIPRALEYLFRTIPQLSATPTVKPQSNGNVIRLNTAACKEERQKRINLLSASSSALDRAHIRTYKAMQQRLSVIPAAILDDIADISLAVWVSFAEIYNEQIYDLLQPGPGRGKQRQRLKLGASNGITYVKNLSTVSVTSGLEAFQILQYGIHNLKYAATTINSHSSRSHSIFTIRLVQASNVDNGIAMSHFNFCDLAGSERLKKTMNVGDRLKESNNINTSLLVLGRCIKGVRDAQKQQDHRQVPFRESKLTQLFQKALSGLESISMIVNMNPSQDMFDESHHVLNFSAIAKDIIVEQVPKVIVKPTKHKRFSDYMEHRKTTTLAPTREEVLDEDIESLRNLVSQLQIELEQQKADLEMEQEIRVSDVAATYREMLRVAQEDSERMKETVIHSCRAEYQVKLISMQDHYESLLKNTTRSPEIINLVDSDDDDDEEEEDGLEVLRMQLTECKRVMADQQLSLSMLQRELTSVNARTKMEVMELQEKLRLSIIENQALKARVAELQGTLEEGVAAYKEMQEDVVAKEEEVNHLLEERLELVEKLAELEQLNHHIVLHNSVSQEEASGESGESYNWACKVQESDSFDGLSYLCDRTNILEYKDSALDKRNIALDDRNVLDTKDSLENKGNIAE